jgi:hypothetical protein
VLFLQNIHAHTCKLVFKNAFHTGSPGAIFSRVQKGLGGDKEQNSGTGNSERAYDPKEALGRTLGKAS